MSDSNNHYFESDKNFYKEKKLENKKDFHKSFWPMIIIFILIVIGSFLCGVSRYHYKIKNYIYLILSFVYFAVFIIGFVMRTILAKKNLPLARGFMWGSIIMVSIPIIVASLFFGVCLIAINR
ncbi:hypothetical protein [Fusobacterium sp. PH5-44]|uniref:hypothetical protein n=1 Tax=unclassified Fusobacterium TaxID=2648384 RepID=UPI003D24BE0C